MINHGVGSKNIELTPQYYGKAIIVIHWIKFQLC